MRLTFWPTTALALLTATAAACGNSFTDAADAGPDAPASSDATAGETGPDARGLMGPEAGPDTSADRTAETAAPDAATFDPSQIAGCILWLRADRGVTADGNGKVSAWANQCGSANTVHQATAALQPTVGAFGPNGTQGISFDGARILRSSTMLGYGGGPSLSVFVVLKMTAGFALSDLSTGGGFAFQDKSGNRDFTIANAGELDFGAVTAGFELWGVIAPNYTATVSSPNLYANGASLFTANISFFADNATSDGLFAVGGRHRGADEPSFQGVVSEIIGYDSALGDANRLRIEGYVNARYALY